MSLKPRVPVLTFHALADDRSPVAFPAQRFARLMRRLASRGWSTLSVAAFLSCIRGETPIPERSFVITFDDGYASVLRDATPILFELGFGAILFVSTDLVGRPVIFPRDAACPRQAALTWDEIRQLRSRGIEIGSHACHHVDLRHCADDELVAELRGSRERIEAEIGAPVPLFAYPFGALDVRVANEAIRVYEGCFTTELAEVRPGMEPARLPRLDAFYLGFLADRGDLDASWVRAWLAVRRAGRAVRSALANGASS